MRARLPELRFWRNAVFPQIADGDGFSTQFILLNPSGPSSTTLSFFGESGTPLAVGKC